LGRAMNRLMRLRPGACSSDFGELYVGQSIDLSPSEERLVQQLRTASMPLERARGVFRCFNGDVPWLSRYHLIEWVAAFMRLYAHEMSVPTSRGGRSLAGVMITMAEPARLEWYLNATRWLPY